MRIVIDLDGTLCEERQTFERTFATAKPGAAEFTRNMRNAGHTIIIYTARSWAESAITEQWLANHGIVYDFLILGKPIYDVWIDDRAIKFEDWSKIDVSNRK